MSKIFYIGTDPKTLEILLRENEVTLISKNDFLFKLDLNPINIIPTLIYALNFKKIYLNCKISFFIKKIENFATGYKKKYFKYILYINDNKIKIVDVDTCNSSIDVDLIVVNVWGILDDQTLKIPKFGSLNIHPSKLPKNRGSLPTLWTLKDGDKNTALSIIELTQGIDDGRLVFQSDFNILKDWDYLNVENKVFEILDENLNVVINKYLASELKTIEQDEAEKTYTETYNKYREIRIDEEDINDIFNKVNLYPYLDPYTYCYIKIENRQVVIKKIKKTFTKNKRNELIYISKVFLLFFNKNGNSLCARLFLDICIVDSLYLLYKYFIKNSSLHRGGYNLKAKVI